MTSVGRIDMDGIAHNPTCYANVAAQGQRFSSIEALRAASGVHVGRTADGDLRFTCTVCAASATWSVLQDGSRGSRVDQGPDEPSEAQVLAKQAELLEAGLPGGIGSLAKALHTSEATIRRRLGRLK